METDVVKHEEMKNQTNKERIRRVRNIIKSNLNGRNIISFINSKAVSIVRFGTEAISWTKMELVELD